jgi:flagellin-like protein
MKSNHPAPASGRAVSPVVGTAILIGIAVVLATVIGVFAFVLTDQPSEKPNAELSISQSQVDIDGRDAGGAQQTYSNVLQVTASHEGGDGMPQRTISVRLRAESSNNTASGYLLDYNTTEQGGGSPYVNRTEPGWNVMSDRRVGVGDSSDYVFFATKQVGEDENAVQEGQDRDNLWRRAHCAVIAFGDTRGGGGSIELNGDSSESVGVTRDCPFGSTNAVITGGQISEGGRIAPGDTVRVVWSPPGEDLQQPLTTFEVADPDE